MPGFRVQNVDHYYAFGDGGDGELKLCGECAQIEKIEPHVVKHAKSDIEPGEEVPCDGCPVIMRNEGRDR